MLKDLTTEARNPLSEEIDRLSPLEIARLMNSEDAGVASAVGREAESIARAIELIADRMRQGGRLIYIGAGTSGRLGVLDAAECPPTFNTRPEQVVGVIAGGATALTRAVEGAEDHPEKAVEDLRRINLSARDVVVGIATSGRTPYVIGGLRHARSQGAATVGLSCNPDSQLTAVADVMIAPIVGPEVISGSTRLKAGTATKLVLNMLSTGTMVRLGKTYGNLMVDLRATNQKLVDRSRRIVAALTGLTEGAAEEQLRQANGEVKTAIVAQQLDISPDEARRRLERAGGHLRGALEIVAECDRVSQNRQTDERLSPSHYVLGVEGGGTKCIALIAACDSSDVERLVGRGTTGPANPKAVGFETACRNMLSAIEAARQQANIGAGPFAAACFALAGADRESDRAALTQWADTQPIALHTRIENDALPILAAAAAECRGIALISGTGSFCFGRAGDGTTARTGGWGYLLGDEGSGYSIALAGLRAAARAADGRGPETQLLPAVLEHLGLPRAEQLIPTVYRPEADRPWIASLTGVVFTTAERGDAVARQIVKSAGDELAELVAVTAAKLGFTTKGFPLALSGGVLLNSPLLRERLRAALAERRSEPAQWVAVNDPAVGTLRLARQLLHANQSY